MMHEKTKGDFLSEQSVVSILYDGGFGKFGAAMRFIRSLLICLSASTTSFAQYPTDLVKPEYYPNGELESHSIFDSTTQKWKKTDYYMGGAIAKERFFEKDGFTFTDTAKIFFTNGNLVYKAVFRESSLYGEFIEFYLNGKIKRKGEYFKSFKTGLWTEYYENGKKKSEGNYLMTGADSAEKDSPYLDRFEGDTITYPDIIYIDSTEKIVGGKLTYEIYVDSTWTRTEVYATVRTPKDGAWKYWDKQGNLLREENYAMGILQKRKKK